MGINLNLKRNEDRFKNIETDLLSTFYRNATNKSNKKFRFGKVDGKFTAFLPHLKDGAVKLYLYYAIAANNETGESWHSIDTISQKLGATERSIGNWNNQLEDLGLIYRTSNGKKSKATFVLPLTGFAIKMNLQQIVQVLEDLNLYEANLYTKVFGQVQTVTKLYIKSESGDSFHEVVCVHLRRVNSCGSIDLNIVDTFLYTVSPLSDANTETALSEFQGDGKVAIIDGEKEFRLGTKTPQSYRCYFINESSKVDDTAIYEIMTQLTDDVDLTELPAIAI